ncbi:DUF3558 family protein [Saccharopolyspora sp. NPDC002376]
MVGMRTKRLVVAATGVAAGLVLAGCSTPVGDVTPTKQQESPNVLAGVDPCKILSAEDVQAFGVSDPGEPVDQGIGEQGCDYSADDLAFTVYKAEDHDRGYYESRKDNIAVYEPNKVGSRDGIKQITKGSTGQGVCNQVIEVGSGSALVQVSYSADKIPSDDETCAKAMEIAKVVESKLPK